MALHVPQCLVWPCSYWKPLHVSLKPIGRVCLSRPRPPQQRPPTSQNPLSGCLGRSRGAGAGREKRGQGPWKAQARPVEPLPLSWRALQDPEYLCGPLDTGRTCLRVWGTRMSAAPRHTVQSSYPSLPFAVRCAHLGFQGEGEESFFLEQEAERGWWRMWGFERPALIKVSLGSLLFGPSPLGSTEG